MTWRGKEKLVIIALPIIFAAGPLLSDVHGDDVRVEQGDTDAAPTANSTFRSTSNMDARDVQIARQIKHDLLADKSISTFGQNVKVLSEDGIVTLTGPVHSQYEKVKVMRCAQNIAGSDNVVDKMRIAHWEK